MPRIKLFLMRHSKSCCNHIRHDEDTADIPLSQQIRDPALSIEGHRIAKLYGPMLRQHLKEAGFDVNGATIASSMLQRAKQTAFLVFNRESRPLNYFAENGAIPENTPANAQYTKPDWIRFVKQLAAITKDGDSIAVVGHGSYLGSLWPSLTGSPRKTRLNNLDGILVDLDVTTGGNVKVHKTRELVCPLHANDHGDTCNVADNQKIVTLRRMKGGATRRQKRRSQRSKRKSQRGGYASMPLGFHQAGAQFNGTSAYATGTQSAFPSNGPMIREPLSQTGGFSPAIMGSFASNGAKLIPIATYMGYRMFTNKKNQKNKKTKKQKVTRRRR